VEDVGVFLFGIAVILIVSAACALIVTGIREERRDRARLERETDRDLGLDPDAPPTATRDDASTVRIDR
jgi:hypothetical protein